MFGQAYLPAVRPSTDGSTLVVDRARAVAARRMDEVAFPSSKAFYFEEFDYSKGQGNNAVHFSDPKSRVSVMVFDSSMRRISFSEANAGWDPVAPCDEAVASIVRYLPIDTRYFPGEPAGVDRVQPYRWTRGGLGGIDVGGKVESPSWCED